jgi:ferredoxin
MTTVIRIDPTRCRGHAICALFLADVIDIDQWGTGRVVAPPASGRRALRRALRAAAACPNGAVWVEEIREHPVSWPDPTAAPDPW